MDPNDNRRPRVAPRSGGEYEGSVNGANVFPLRPKLKTASPFDQLTARLILDQHRRGVLPEAVLAFLLAGAGLRP
jgi:hypothetical protein